MKQFLLTLTILFPLSAKSAFKLRHLDIGNEKKVEIYNVVEDHRGIIFASSNTGILEFDGINWRTIETPNKEASLALGLSKEGKVYVSGLSFIGYLSPNFDGDMELQKISIAPEKLRTLGDVIAIETYNDSVVFIYNNGILLLSQSPEVIKTDNHIRSSAFFNNTLYLVDSDKGLMKLNNRKLEPVRGGSHLGATALTVANNELIGASMSFGVFKILIDEESVSYKALKEIDKSRFRGSLVSDIAYSSKFIYVATIGKGIHVFDRKTYKAFNLGDKTLENVGLIVQSITIDSKGQLWLTNPNGLNVLADRNFQSIENNSKAEKDIFTAYLRSCINTKNQETIFGGAFFRELGGVQTLKASELNRPDLNYQQNALRFNYSSSEIVLANEIEYQTYLKGFDSDWSGWSKRNYREFTNLMWNDYSFQVRARTPDGKVSEIITFDFEISPPWYEQNWFYLLQMFILMNLFGLVVYLKAKKKRKKTSKKLNDVIMGTVWGYSFSTIGMQGVVWAFSGGAAFLAIIFKILMGIFLKPLQKKVDAKMVDFQDDLARNLKQKLEKRREVNIFVPPNIARIRAKTIPQRRPEQHQHHNLLRFKSKNPKSVKIEAGISAKKSA